MELLALMLIAAAPAPPGTRVPDIEVQQQLGRAVCRYSLDRKSIALSGEVRLTLSVDGPAPVEVDTPRPLTPSPDWKVVLLAPATTVEPGGREHWQQTVVFKPFQVGDVVLPLAPIHFRTGNEVRDWEVTWPPRTIQVRSSVQDVDLSSAHPIIGIETLPPAEPASMGWWYASLAAVLIVAVAGLLWRARRRRHTRAATALSPRERALIELAPLEAAGGPRTEQLPELADILRHFLEEQFQLAATRQTTGEFRATLAGAEGFTSTQGEAVAEVLTRCDLVKFAGARFDAETCRRLLSLARGVIAGSGATGQTVSPA